MTTLPRAVIRGALALPRMRPLGDPTPSFGSEWRFSLPQVDFRADFPTLYAAVLETFCVNRRWQTAKPDAQRTAEKPTPAPAPSAEPVSTAPKAAPISPAPPVRPIATAIRSTPRERKIGAACALAGAAVLSWIVLSHLPPSPTERYAARGGDASRGSTEGPIEPAEPAVQISTAAGAPATMAAKDKPATELASAAPLEPLPQPSTHTDEHAPMPRHRAEPAVRPETVVRRPPLPATLPPTAPIYADQQAERAAGQSVADASAAQQETSQPAAPAEPDSESTAVAAARPAAAPGRHAAGLPGYAKDTTWVNHVTHRRITDSPNQFGM
ncbi:hypothetical protein [Trinickia mobilis]|uniref:hypothetical protein n=1 Tax=Trinickia mobilis TaxID=2816356 RepID=UPI001A8E00BB|nr:hypothetical protein [Trinickia mobilis]